MWELSPAVFAVGNEYQIMLPVESECTMWVKVADRYYYDASNGIMRSDTLIHKVTVPMSALDNAGEYTVYLRNVIERKPYFTETEDAQSKTFTFKAVSKAEIRGYHIADTHGAIEEPVRAAEAFGEIDFLILNGDIPDHCGAEKNIIGIYEIASRITKGSFPVVFSRGNHDMRGKYAEKFCEWTPTRDGFSYYTFRLGGIWGMVLDCGEDKVDNHEQYGNMICCHDFRKQQTEFIQETIRCAEAEYLAEGVISRLVICHIPFTVRKTGRFDIEHEIYESWVKLLREYIKPQVILCGHEHRQNIYPCGSEEDSYGQPCPVVIGAERVADEKTTYIAGTGVIFGENLLEIMFTDNLGKQKKTEDLGGMFCENYS